MAEAQERRPPWYGVWTRRRTRRQNLLYVGGFVALGVVGLLAWRPLATAGFIMAAVTAFNVARGATLDG